MARIDHLVYAVADLEDAIDRFAASTGVRPAVGGAHVGRGTHNALVSFGSCYLELIAPDPGQPTPAGSRPFGIDDLSDPAFVAFAVRPDPGETLEALVDQARAVGHDPGPVSAMQRATPTGSLLEWRLTIPAATFPAVVPFLIDWGTTPLPSGTQPGGVELTSFAVQHPEVEFVSAVFESLGLSVPVTSGEPGFDVSIDGPEGPFT